MKFEFEPTEADVKDLMIIGAIKYKKYKIFLYVFLGLFLTGRIIEYFQHDGLRSEDIIPAFISFIIPCLFVLGMYFLILRLVLSRNKGNKDFYGKRTIEFEQNLIILTTPLRKFETQYEALEKLEQSKISYFVYLGAQIFQIPKRAFKSDIEQKEFEAFIASKISRKK